MQRENHPAGPGRYQVDGSPQAAVGDWVWLNVADLQLLIDALRHDGRRVVGPQVADAAVVYRDLERATDLPRGWIDEQDGGHYRLRRDEAAGVFDHVVGPHSLKNFLCPARETIGRFLREDGTWRQLDDLPPRCREVFELARLEGLSQAEIAGRLAISVNTVIAQLAKARQRLERP